MIDLNQVLTFSEAAEKWGFANGNTLRKAVERNKFDENEIRKSGDVWLTTYEAMQRVFGQPRNLETVISMEELSQWISESYYHQEDSNQRLHEILNKMNETILKKKTVIIITSHNSPQNIVRVLKSQSDFDDFQKSLNRYFQSISINISPKEK